jgi:hypothetical protein
MRRLAFPNEKLKEVATLARALDRPHSALGSTAGVGRAVALAGWPRLRTDPAGPAG